MAKSLRNTTMKVNIEVNSKALDDANRRINASIHETDKLERSANQSGKAIEQAGRKYANASSSIRKNADSLKENADRARSASREHSSLASSAKRSGDSFREQKRSVDDSSKSLKDFASTADLAKGALATIGVGAFTKQMYDLGAAAIKVGMEFDKQMSAVQAVSGATLEQFRAMRDQAIELGASTTKSASEVAAGQLELAKAGFTVKQIMAAMPGVISASEASGESMARTAEVMTAALNGFGLKASAASHVADVLAQAANDSAADINDLGYAFKYAAAPAHALGMKLEEVSAAIEIMSDAGIKGETAGTTLRGGLIQLLKPSEETSKMMQKLGITIEDSKGNFVGLANLIQNISQSLEGQTRAQKLANLSAMVGTEAASGFLTLMEAGPEKIRKYTKSLQESDGASKKAADTMSDNLAGSVEQMKGAFESAAISVSDTLKPAVKEGVEVITHLVEGFNNLSPSAKSMVVWGSIIVGGIIPVSFALYNVHKAIKSVREVMSGAKVFFSNYRTEMAKTGNEALVMASKIQKANATIAASQSISSIQPTSKTKSYSELMKEAQNKKIRSAVTDEAATKGGFFSKVGNRVKEGMQFSGKATKAVPIVGTALAGLSLIGMSKDTVGESLGGFGGSLAGGAAGAAIGSAILPGIGTAIGGMLGSIAGTKFGIEFGKTIQKKWPKIVQSLKKAFEDPLSATVKFGKGVSESTAKAYNSYKKLSDGAIVMLNKMNWSGKAVSKDTADSLIKTYDRMADTINKNFKTKFEKSEKTLSNFLKSSGFSQKEQNAILNSMKSNHQKQQDEVRKAQDRIQKILEKASKEKRALNEDEQKEINKLQSKMNTFAVKSLSKSAKEQQTILTMLQNESSEISARQAADVVKQSKKARDGAVKEAEKKYKEVVAAANQEYLENKSITEEQYKAIISKAKETRDGAVKEAEDMHKKVVEQAKKQAKEHVDQVDWETGQVLSKWDTFKIGLAKVVNAISSGINKVLEFFGSEKRIPMWKPAGYSSASAKSKVKSYAKGTNFHPGGPAVVGEEGVELAYVPYKGATLVGQNGAEIVDLPPGTRVLTHAKTKQMLSGGLKGSMPGYARGIGGSIQEAASTVVNKVKNTASGVIRTAGEITDEILEFITNPASAVKKLFSKNTLQIDIGGIGKSALNYLKTNAIDYLKEKVGDFAGIGAVSGAGAAQARKWILAAMAITNTPASYLNALMTIAKKESGFNPKAINLWDINAKRGTPSKGLFQTIDPTFNAYKLPGFNDIWNPVHNAVAAIRYMNARYGSIANVPGLRNMARGKGYVGYKNGGRKMNHDQVIVGEDGPEIVDLPFGSQIHNNRKTQELLKQKRNITINFNPVINIKIEGNSNDTNESKIQRAVNDAMEKAFKDFISIIDSGVAY
ncbi:phage tail tape measure protein [Aeribacillus sp. FSL M8-0235]|uniref:phage tail tape measure protein n=1 Tax=Aeribacillus sp. FSL M8-0235 TaxID=2954576 RepID=UPI0030F9753A